MAERFIPEELKKEAVQEEKIKELAGYQERKLLTPRKSVNQESLYVKAKVGMQMYPLHR